jgi:hypothetical protein
MPTYQAFRSHSVSNSEDFNPKVPSSKVVSSKVFISEIFIFAFGLFASFLYHFFSPSLLPLFSTAMNHVHRLIALTLGSIVLPCLQALAQQPTAPSASPNGSTQADEYIAVPLNISFVPPLSVSHAVRGASGKKAVNLFSGNILIGWADRLAGVEGSTIWGAYSDDSFGVQASGVGNSMGGSFEGVQSAGVVNITGGHLRGAQGAGVVNIVGGSLYGAQGAGVVNIVGGGIDGVQGAGVLNITGSTTAGIQAAGVGNIAGTMNGIQVAGVFNSAKEMNGLHVALFNFAERGTGVPIGLMSFVKNAGMKVEISGDELGFVHGFLRTGTQRFANYLGVGTRFQQWGRQLAFTYGLGAEFELAPSIVVGVDGFTSGLVDFGNYYFDFGRSVSVNATGTGLLTGAGLLRLRSVLGIDVFPGFRIFGGVSASWMVTRFTDGREFGVGWSFMDIYNGSLYQRLTPGFVVGVRLF